MSGFGNQYRNVAMMGLGHDDYQVGLQDDTMFGFSPPGSPNGRYASCRLAGETNVGRHTFACRIDDTTWRVDADGGTYSTSGACAVQANPNQRHGYCFNRQSYWQGKGLAGEYCALRIYRRALADWEVRLNAALDRVRHFGEDPATCALPDGWRFVVTATDTNLEHCVTVGASVAGGGTVTVNGGAPSESVSNWLGEDGTWTVTATATAAEGFAFVCWAGDVSEAERANPTVTATISKDLTAVFRKTDGSAPLTYTWSGLSGTWSDVNGWTDDAGFCGRPLDGDSVVIPAGKSVLMGEASPHLMSVEIAGTLVASNWNTCVWADRVTVADGGVLTCAGPFTGEDGVTNRVYVKCGDLTVASGGQIDVSRRGFAGGLTQCAAGYGPGTIDAFGVGASHGGIGGRLDVAAFAADPYGSAEAPETPGSGGKAGYEDGRYGGLQTCPGGGVVRIEAAGAVVVNGQILSDGRSPHYSSTDTNDLFDGPGSGGSIWITCRTFAGTNGVIRADGGGGNDPREPKWLYAKSADGLAKEIDSRAARSAGGGRIALAYDGAAQRTEDVVGMTVSAGAGLHTGPTRGQTYATMDRYRSGADCGTVWFTDEKLVDATLGVGLTGQLVALTNYTYRGDLAWTNGHVRFATPGATVRIDGSLTMTNGNSRLEVGGYAYRKQSVAVDVYAGTKLNALTVAGDCTLAGGARLDIRSAAKDESSDFATWGGEVAVGGTLCVKADASVYAWCDIFTCTAPRFRVGSLRVEEGGLMSSEGRGGAGAANTGTYRDLGIGTPVGYSPLGHAAYVASLYHYAGNHFTAGGVGADYKLDWVPAQTYDDEFLPTLAGAGAGSNGYGDGGAGGGVICVESAGALVVDGEINADGAHLLKPSGFNNAHGLGGGAGGTICLKGTTFTGGASARLSAKGGAGSRTATACGGAGAGGCIAVWTGEPYAATLPKSRTIRQIVPTGATWGGAFAGTCDASGGGRVTYLSAEPDDTWAAIPDYAQGADGTIWFCHVKKPGGGLMIIR